MNEKSELQEYKEFVKQKLDELTTCLAYISAGDFSRRFNVYELEDNEFTDAFCGLDLMMDDLVEAREELQEVNENLESTVTQRTSELESEKERLAVTLRSITDGVIAADMENSIQLMNKAAEDITGYKFEEAKGTLFHTVFKLDEKSGSKFCPHKQMNGKGVELNLPVKEGEAVIRNKNNQDRTVAYCLSPIIEHTNNTIIGKVVVFRDIKEKKRIENELFKMKKLESVGILAGGIAHDFNNILTGIISNLQLAIKAAPENVEMKGLLKDAEKASVRAIGLTKQLLTFSKGGAPVRENASLTDIIHESTRLCLSGTSITADFGVSRDLWLANVDKGQISQVLNNILINAVQAMPDGGNIEIAGRNTELKDGKDDVSLLDYLNPGKYVEISVKDSGVGIDKGNLEKVFDPYFTTKEEGSGLGLSISYSIIKAHNGHITATSNKKGAVISFYLPANPSAKLPPVEKLKKVEKGNGSILIMDDDTIVLTALQKLLVLLGYSATCAQNGEEAIEIYKQRMNDNTPFSAVILDLTVRGGMGGKEAVKKLREIDSNAKVIVTSGYSNDPIISDYSSYGFDGVIPKPFTMDELSSAISNVISS